MQDPGMSGLVGRLDSETRDAWTCEFGDVDLGARGLGEM